MQISKRVLHQALACSPAFFIQFILGVSWGWIAPTLQKLQTADSGSPITITIREAAWVGSFNEVGRVIGPFLAPILLDNFGRQRTLILVAVTQVVSWTIMMFTYNIYIILAARLVFGAGNGMSDVSSSIYVTEVCAPEFRGIGGSAMLLIAAFGMILGNSLTTYLSFTNVAIANTALALCVTGWQYFGVETPYFLTMKDKHEKARQNLMWLRADSNVDDELKQIRKNVDEENEKKKSLKVLFSDSINMRSILVAVGLYLLISSVGFHTVFPYASLIFSPSETFSSNEFAILLSVAAFIAAIASIFIVEKVDRRYLIIYSFVVIIASDICTCVLLYARDIMNYNVKFYPWLLFSCIALYALVVATVGPAMFVLISELLPLSVRAIGGSMAVTASSVGSFATAIIFWRITEWFGMGANFIMFAVVSLLLIIFVYTVVPETRGKLLHEMHKKPTDMELS